MSTENRASPAFHGRLNLQQQRKRAKELLKAATAGDPEAIARISRRLTPPPEAPRLADTQRVIALEDGFPSWLRFKRHIEEVEPRILSWTGN